MASLSSQLALGIDYCHLEAQTGITEAALAAQHLLGF